MSAKNKSKEGILKRVTSSISGSQIIDKGKQAASVTQEVAWKLAKSTGRAMWYTGTSFLITVVPLILAMEREAHYNDLEMQQAALFGGGAGGAGAPP